jgi:quercetin dioxygenase-like cupin family protein
MLLPSRHAVKLEHTCYHDNVADGKGGPPIQQADFEAELKAKGFVETESKALDPRPVNHGHTHDYDISGLVLSGVFIVNQGEAPVTYRAGDIFFVPAGRSHTEEIGGEGARILVGKRLPSPV